MGRHETDPIPIFDKIRDSGPMKRIRNDAPTEVIPTEEARRRAWPVALILGLVLAAFVGLPVGLANLAAEESPEPFPSAVSVQHSATPDPPPSPTRPAVRPTATVTKNRIEYRTLAPKPGPTVTKTIYVTLTPKPSPRPTKTIKVPGPTKTITETDVIYQDRCFRVRDGIITGEIECP